MPACSAMAAEDAFEGSWSDLRRKGLTTAEKVCMRKYSYACPSADWEAKMAQWSGGAPRRRKKPLAEPNAPTGGDALGPLDSIEKACGDILERLLPLPPRQRLVASRGARLSPLSRPTLMGGGSRSAPSFGLEPPAAAPPAAAAAAQQAAGGLRLVRRPPKWDPAASELQSNVIRLIQGASANKVEREVGGKIRFVTCPKAETQHKGSEEFAGSSGDDGGGGSSSSQAYVGRAVPSHRAARGTQDLMGHPLHHFRRRMFKIYSSVGEAFDSLNVDRNKRLDMREWCEVLVSSQMCGMFEARVIFELMDANRDGTLTIHEFNVGIEAIAPVVSLGALRKRLVCLGFASILQAIAVMDGGGEDSTMQPLTLAEFAAAMRRAWIIEDKEHRAIFNLVRDPNDPSGRASLSDLACGLSAVSPCMLLSEARQQLESKWGSLPAAFEALEDDWLRSAEAFEEKGSEWLGMTRAEAAKMFRFTDVDRSGELSRTEVMGSLRLSMPSLPVEDLRRRVQQTYRGIEAALREGFSHEGKDLDDRLRFTPEELQDLLEPVDMSAVEKKQLVRYMVATSDQGLTLSEFYRGVRLFAPSCLLEGVRLQLLQTYDRVADAFRHIRSRRAPLCRAEFLELLAGAGVTVGDLDTVFDLLDVRSAGVVTLSELIAALQGSSSGTRKWVSRKEREEGVERSVHEELAPLRGSISELKLGLRRGLRAGGAEPEKALKERRRAKDPSEAELRQQSQRAQQMHHSRSAPSGAAVTYQARATASALLGGGSAEATPRLPPARGATPQRGERVLPLAPVEEGKDVQRAMMRKTFQNFTSSLEALPPQQAELKQKAVDAVRGYFVSHQKVFGAQEDMLRRSYSKAALHREVMELRRFERPQLLRHSVSALSTATLGSQDY